MYQNKMPVFEMISGASIAVAVLLLIIPGFLTDFLGFLLIPATRKILISFLISKKDKVHQENTNILDGEIIENKDNKDEL